MKVYVLARPFQAVISNLYSISREKNNTFSNLICLRAETGLSLEVLAMNSNIRMKQSVAIKKGTLKEVIVDAQTLYDFIKDIESETLSFELLEKKLFIQSNSFRCELNIYKENSSLLEMISPNSSNWIEVNTFHEVLQRTKFSLTSNHFSSNIDGVYFYRDGKNILKATATNGYVLTELTISNVDISPEDLLEGILIPTESINELLRVLKFNNKKTLGLTIQGNYLILSNRNDLLLNIRLGSEKYIDLKNILPKKFKHSFKCNKSNLLKTLKRVSIFSNERSKAIQFQLQCNSLTLKSSPSLKGSAKEGIEVFSEDLHVEFSFNSNYLSSILENITSEEVTFKYNHSFSPFVLVGENEKEQINLIVPMRF